jgi:hypothetical protein
MQSSATSRLVEELLREWTYLIVVGVCRIREAGISLQGLASRRLKCTDLVSLFALD